MPVDLVTLTFNNHTGISDQDIRFKETLLNLFQSIFLIQENDLTKDCVHSRYNLVHEENQASPQIPLVEIVIEY